MVAAGHIDVSEERDEVGMLMSKTASQLNVVEETLRMMERGGKINDMIGTLDKEAMPANAVPMDPTVGYNRAVEDFHAGWASNGR